MASEPIQWVRPNYQPPRITRPGPDGEPIVEKFPATAKPPEDHPLFGKPVRRWELMVDDCGNVVRAVYSGGAADYQVDHPNYGAAIKARHRRGGWFPLASCPLVLARGGGGGGGGLDGRWLSPSIRDAEPCEPGTYSASRPCAHAQAEVKHRQQRNARREEKRADAFRSEAEKMQRAVLEQQGETNSVTTKTVQELAEMVKALIGGGGVWPMARPNLTQEEYEAELKKRAETRTAAPEAPTSDDELAKLLMDADADEAVMPGDPEPAPPTTGKKRGR